MRFRITVASLAACASLFAVQARADSSAEQCAQNANVAQIARDDGWLIEARDRFIKCVAETCPQVIRTACDEWLADVDKRLPSVVFGVTQGGRDVLDVQVTLDGAPVAVAGRGVPVDPGTHTVRVRRANGANGANVTLQIVVHEGEHHRLISAELPLDDGPLPLSRSPGTSRPLTSYVLAGVAVLAAGSFSYFALRTSSAWHSLAQGCPACTSTQIMEEHQLALAADISLGVTAAAATGAVLSYLLSRDTGIKVVPTDHGALFGVVRDF